jgi:hypothetical protein
MWTGTVTGSSTSLCVWFLNFVIHSETLIEVSNDLGPRIGVSTMCIFIVVATFLSTSTYIEHVTASNNGTMLFQLENTPLGHGIIVRSNTPSSVEH